jgi:integrase
MVTWTRDVAAWLAYMTTAGLSQHTVALRAYHLGRMAKELGGSPAAMTADRLTEWLASKAWSASTRRSYRASLRAFYKWAVLTGRVPTSPAHELPAVRVPRGKPRPAPEEAFRLALRTADDRARLAILLAGVCGLRRGEIAAARREDVERDLLGWALRVRGKGGHVRLVPLTDEIERTIRLRPPGWLFPSSHGGHLTPHHLGKIVSRCLPDGLTTHTLRHRCGTQAYAATKDLRAVQELLGHAKPETTAIYTFVSGDAIRAAVEAVA